MAITEPMKGENPSDNVICPRCGSSLPPYATFCRMCGERITKEINEERKTRAKYADEDAQEQKDDDTVRIPPLSRAHWKIWQAYTARKNNGLTGQTYKINLLPLNAKARVESARGVGGMKPTGDQAPISPVL